MPSIFIWKSNNSNVSKDIIRYYVGVNWILEDIDNRNSKSYQLNKQNTIEYNGINILVNDAKLMPTDWIGSELLEVIQCPYQLIKSDKYATYELIGNWNRVILHDTSYKYNIDEFIKILSWIDEKQTHKKHIREKNKCESQDIQESHIHKKIKRDTHINKQLEYTPLDNNTTLTNIESFEDAILKINNITKEQLIHNITNIHINNTNYKSHNQNTSKHYTSKQRKHDQYINTLHKQVKLIINDTYNQPQTLMSIPLCCN